MTVPNIIIVDDARSARAAAAAMTSVLREAMPGTTSATGDPLLRAEAIRFATAQWAVLRGYRKAAVPHDRRDGILVSTRWLELCAEPWTDGVFSFDGRSVALGPVDGSLPPLPVDSALLAEISAWNRAFSDRLRSGPAHGQGDAWVREHDARGMEIVRQLRRGLGHALRWTVRFVPLCGDPVAAPEELSAPVIAARGGDGTPDPSWRFGITPAEAPPLVGVFDRDTLAAAMMSFRDVLLRWETLGREDLAVGSAGTVGLDVLRQHLLAQSATILSWSVDERMRVRREERGALPVNDVQVAREITLMADYSSTGLWDWQGCPVEPEEVPLAPSTLRRVNAWLGTYEAERGWDTPDRRPFTLDQGVFDRWGMSIARDIRRDLPDWRVFFRPEGQVVTACRAVPDPAET